MSVLYVAKKLFKFLIHNYLESKISQHCSTVDSLENKRRRLRIISFWVGKISSIRNHSSTVLDAKKVLNDFYYTAKCRWVDVIWTNILFPIVVRFLSSHTLLYLLRRDRHCSSSNFFFKSLFALQFLTMIKRPNTTS